MSEKIKILYIDDEPNNLLSFKALLRLDCHVLTAGDTDKAEKLLEDSPDIRIIFCDQRMPGKTGVEFFEEISSRFPLPVRVLLTGYADIEAVIDAINKSHIYRYVKKPWIYEDLISAINESNKFYLANSMLAVKNNELQKAYNELDKFAYSVTHDIRGPLSGILGAINLAKDMHDVSEVKDMMKLMEKSVKKLNLFIQGVHDYFSQQRGELQIKEIDLKELVSDLEDIYKTYYTSNHIHFVPDIRITEPLRTDGILLKTILNNLLSNAFKYQRKDNDEKLVELSINVSKGMITIAVKDNGIGIEPNYINDIFDLFFRATALEAGSGFGLYNVKNALIKLNGDIKVDSKVNTGTTFTVTIPNK